MKKHFLKEGDEVYSTGASLVMGKDGVFKYVGSDEVVYFDGQEVLSDDKNRPYIEIA